MPMAPRRKAVIVATIPTNLFCAGFLVMTALASTTGEALALLWRAAACACGTAFIISVMMLRTAMARLSGHTAAVRRAQREALTAAQDEARLTHAALAHLQAEIAEMREDYAWMADELARVRKTQGAQAIAQAAAMFGDNGTALDVPDPRHRLHLVFRPEE